MQRKCPKKEIRPQEGLNWCFPDIIWAPLPTRLYQKFKHFPLSKRVQNTSFCYYGNGREATYWKTGKLFRFRPYIKVKYFFSTDLKWMVGMLLPRETNPPRYHLSLVVQQPLHQLHGKIMGPRHQYRQGSTVTWHKAPSPELLPQFLPWLS